MNFTLRDIQAVKGIGSTFGYKDLLKQQFTGDITDCITGDLETVEIRQGNIFTYLLLNQRQQIGFCKVIIDTEKQIFYVSSIAIVPNLQKKGIATLFYAKFLTQRFSSLYPGYTFTPGPHQTPGRKKQWNK